MTTAVEMMEYLRSIPLVEDMATGEETTQHYLSVVQREYAKLDAKGKQDFADHVTFLNTQRYNTPGDMQTVISKMPVYQLQLLAQWFKDYSKNAQE
jgi:hypothetical protein